MLHIENRTIGDGRVVFLGNAYSGHLADIFDAFIPREKRFKTAITDFLGRRGTVGTSRKCNADITS